MSTDATDESDSLAQTEVFGFRIKSDNLRTLRPLVDWAAEQTGRIDRLPRVYLIMDANTIRGELRFRIKRNDPDGRTQLDEILASGIATVFAPPFLVEEVEKHLEKWSRQLKVPVHRITAEWKLYQEGLVFCHEVPVSTEPARRLAARDPKDLPYVNLAANLSAEAILTADKDIIEAGSPTADSAVVLDLREYARNQSVVVTITAGSATGVLLFVQALMALGRLLVRSVVGLILSLAAGALLYVLHRKEKSKVGSSSFTRIWKMFKDSVNTLLRMLEQSHNGAKLRWNRLMTAFSKAKRRTLRQFVFAVCAIARRALTIIEIVTRVLAEGHRTRAKRFRSQVRRCLKTDRRFVETPKGWILESWAAAPSLTR
jgi:predicted nucleic acid-binding protein